MNRDLDIIFSRLDLLFKRVPRTRYWITIANDPYDHSYNVFFNSQKPEERLRSIPLHKLTDYDLLSLERNVNGLKSNTQLSIKFIGFTGQRWPTSQKLIQKRRDHLE